jgi:hypothetical protein
MNAECPKCKIVMEVRSIDTGFEGPGKRKIFSLIACCHGEIATSEYYSGQAPPLESVKWVWKPVPK